VYSEISDYRNVACTTVVFLRRKLVSRLEAGYSRFELTDSFRRVSGHTNALREMRAAIAGL
jgi:hypothetical protein